MDKLDVRSRAQLAALASAEMGDAAGPKRGEIPPVAASASWHCRRMAISASAPTSIDLVDVLHRSGQATRVFVAGMGPDQWSCPTSCDMDVRALVNHFASGLFWAAELAEGKTMAEIGSSYHGDVLGDDPLAACDRAVSAAVAAFGAPGVLERICTLPYGDVPGGVFCSHKVVDVFIHGWDIAGATVQDSTLDPQLVEIVYALFKPCSNRRRQCSRRAASLARP